MDIIPHQKRKKIGSRQKVLVEIECLCLFIILYELKPSWIRTKIRRILHKRVSKSWTTKFYTGRHHPEVQLLTFYTDHLWQKRYPFRIPSS